MSDIKPEQFKQHTDDCEAIADSRKGDKLTISTKLSTEQLICKTPRTDHATQKQRNLMKANRRQRKKFDNLDDDGTAMPSSKSADDSSDCSIAILYLAVMQILFGLLMSTFGILVILHDASLSQIGGGLWGGCIAVSAGTAGILAAAKSWCPLRTGAQRLAQTAFLALSLVSLAMAQLVFVLAATGLARDVRKNEIMENNAAQIPQSPDDIVEALPSNYPSLLANIGLLLVSGIECVCAAFASYKCARLICPCFRSNNDNFHHNLKLNGKDAFVTSWLHGKHSTPPSSTPIYLVAAAPSTLTRSNSKLSVSPIFAMPSPLIGPPVYPLIPAPLGPVPSPIIPPPPRERHYRRYHHKDRPAAMHAHCSHNSSRSTSAKSRSKSKERVITTEEVARTYTGLDRTIAEEFIQICDSRNNSLCSDSSCQESCQCTSSDVGSRDYLIEKH